MAGARGGSLILGSSFFGELEWILFGVGSEKESQRETAIFEGVSFQKRKTHPNGALVGCVKREATQPNEME